MRKLFCSFLFMFPFSCVYKIFHHKKKIWIVSENLNCMTACDNGYVFFEYLVNKVQRKDTYFVINRNSPYLEKVIEHSKQYIFYGSLKHWLYYLIADKRISTHNLSAPSGGIFYVFQRLGIMMEKSVFLQHGITQNNLEELYYENCRLRMFICGAKPEYDYVKECFHYPQENIKYTGFARFDNLHEVIADKKQIVIMPTWRRWIALDMEKEEDFVKTEYYSKFQHLLDNLELRKMIEENQITVIFYVHQLMDKFLHFFRTPSDKIIIASREQYDIQELIKKSALLITDFSSVFFDFAYMKKPMIYYQFDNGLFRSNHYKEGYFSYEIDGFGPVTDKEEDIISYIKKLIKNNMCIEEKYIERIDRFFPLNDMNNCERIYDAIKKMG